MLSDDVNQFIKRHIDSVERLEVLLLLEEEHRIWSALAVSSKLGLSLESATTQLEGLAAANLLERKPTEDEPTFRFAPNDETLRQTARKLGDLYRRRRIEVLNAVLANSLDRVSKSLDSLRSFSDAFRIRKDKNPKDNKDG